jgi:nitroreductase
MADTPLNDRSTPIGLLRTRRSGKARDLVAPGPLPTELDAILEVAARVPDHGKLAPWRFVVIDDRDAFAALIERLYRRDRPDAGRLELETMRAFAHHAPLLVALLFQPRESHIPLWEQQLSVGAAAYALLAATHAHGYAGNWLTGPAAYLGGMADSLGCPGGQVAGFFFLGSPAKPLEERPRPASGDVIMRFPG